MIKFCKGCYKKIPLMRIKALPNTLTCVDCSDVNMKSCVTVLKGNVDRDDTWVDIIFIDGKNNDPPSLNTQDFEEE
tara:strand:- start:2122 stop:2349 length:228 start_codon:yes stop_codon:yes gene_type:complete